MKTFRDTLRDICPPWLQHGVAERYLYAIGVQLDVIADSMIAALEMRFPNDYSEQSLPYIGRDRRIRRGRTETAAVYSSRLTRWLRDHKRRGGPYAMLAQLYAHYAPSAFPIELIYRNGRRYKMATDGTVSHDQSGWIFDSVAPEKWARWVLVYRWPTNLPDPGAWDSSGETWNDPSSTWDYNLPPEEIDDLRLIPREWNAAHCFGRILLFGPNTELWDYPADHTWDESGQWDTSGVQLDLPIE